ncbi:E3 ubiquitin-protein ligase HRD1 NDAI_0C02770 [Naumovozyma dairenensis CBS 421]|uniref:RING-type E3 ubiquitin transferase n=1 Tax=Naumovozyma dairenensis (strain ATCC 10597 / BCRC 20456 / CBS 421 / NBRC 0211 / NRRL Y-12639) TaxID=1071378 RepID=G0W826_NAUDC|nr:hypothetical protein NDAI_0C02770 [Naumovozyma dairenensis CBS 421]CCD23937.1 hypothetical protein NDAI_0C02770 [Naumovozyma dairenensis CBS 421]
MAIQISMLNSKKFQFVIFSISVYLITFFTIINAANSSTSFLHLCLKLNEGFNIMIITIFILLNSLLSWKLITWFLFNDLRLIEQEHIMERLPFTVINFIVMATMFNERFFFTLTIYGLLLISLRVYHWILKDRLEFIIQTINDSTSMTKIIFSKFSFNLISLSLINLKLIQNCLTWDDINFWKNNQNLFNSIMNYLINPISSTTISNGINNHSNPVYLMLGMEFSILLLEYFNVLFHSLLSLFEFYKSKQFSIQQQQIRQNNLINRAQTTQNDENEINIGLDIDIDDDEEDDDETFNGLEGKFIYEKIIDLFTRFLMTIIHVSLLLPLNIPMILVKDILWDFFSLYRNAMSLYKIWKNNQKLESALPNMTPDDLQHSDNVCIICMDDLLPSLETLEHATNVSSTTPSSNHYLNIKKKKKPKKLPCGHFLHFSCLKNWMERSQTCPICRLDVFDKNGNVKVYPNTNTNTNVNDSSHDQTSENRPPSTSTSNIIPGSNTNITTNTPIPRNIDASNGSHEVSPAASPSPSPSPSLPILKHEQHDGNPINNFNETKNWYEFKIDSDKSTYANNSQTISFPIEFEKDNNSNNNNNNNNNNDTIIANLLIEDKIQNDSHSPVIIIPKESINYPDTN